MKRTIKYTLSQQEIIQAVANYINKTTDENVDDGTFVFQCLNEDDGDIVIAINITVEGEE